ncbi:APC family permease [Erysipelothrix sp. HDW6C]|uniref:APC family permease n=1 Tax=Erysipelothrix sp. HDW6C TaxID=2714930 RepID=UPI00140E95D4|nr:APC family permease [Erysipelothrix sp. HDW6C]QIK69110.1 APC family permease [Erysipelothrix sp. HDW6C]
MEKEKKFGLFTTIAMIVGIVVGSGIFFKTDDILIATQGSVILGVLLWVVGAFGIIFGGLCVSEYAKRTSEAGGLITYMELAWGKTMGYLSGWFQVVFYYPAIIGVLAWITSVYIGLIFGISNPLDWRLWVTTLVILIVIYALNIINTKSAGKFQNITLIIKIVALLSLSIVGIIFGEPQNLASTAISGSRIGGGLFVGLIACAFSYDGWFVAPAVAHEIKNPKKNLVKALIVAPIIILAIYLAYFIGINAMLGPEKIMQLGDGSVGYIAEQLFGSVGTKVIYTAVIISILGSINGLVLGYIRLPYSLAIRDSFPRSDVFKTMNTSLDIPVKSAILSFVLILIWLGLHRLSVFNVQWGPIHFSGLQIDSLPIVLTYVFYGLLYVRTVVDEVRYHKLGVLKGYVFPLLALLGASFVLYGGMSQPQSIIYFIISFVGIACGYLVMGKPKTTT